MAVNSDLIRRGLAALGLDSGTVTDRLVTYAAELEMWNPTYGLVNATGDELVVKHLLDSLAPFAILSALLTELDGRYPAGSGKLSCLADIGTGAGLPGIPLALAFPDRHVYLVERMGKRVRFLENQKIILALTNASIIESEAERAAGPFDLVVFRAFRPFTELKLFRSIAGHVTPGGIIAAYKGKPVTAREELAAISDDPVLGNLARSAVIVPVGVPFLDDERCLVVMRT